VFRAANADGSKVFFTDKHRLTTGAGEGTGSDGEEGDLYVFEPGSGHLTDLSEDHNAHDLASFGGAGVQGVLGVSADGSYVYFVADGVLTTGEGAGPGDCYPEGRSGAGERQPGTSCNVYERHFNGSAWEAPKFIAALSAGDINDWETASPQYNPPTSSVSRNGLWLAFMSEARLTAYDNRDANSGIADEEVYLYDAARGRVICASCNPSGARPVGELDADNLTMDRARLWTNSGAGAVATDHWLAANVPGGTFGYGEHALYKSRYLSDSGRLFFNGADPLVPQATSGRENVYEWEPEGAGGCHSSADSGGCVSLISSGHSRADSTFLDASESGNDVFFRTSDALVSADTDTAFDVYDARACSPASPCLSYPSRPPAPCASGDACKLGPTPQPEIFGPPASATFSGPGNLVPSASPRKSTPLTRAQKLAAALKACHTKRPRKLRAVCEAQARRRYGPAHKTTAKRRHGR